MTTERDSGSGCDRRAFLSLAAGGVAGLHPSLSGAATRQSRPSSAPESWIPSRRQLDELPSIMRVASLPGLSMAVVEDGAVAWTKALGVGNATTKEPVREETLFEAGSISKAVFAYAVLQLADQRLLDLDRPLVAYHRPSYLPGDDRIEGITARHVLTHTSGLPNWGVDGKPETFRPAFTPGSAFAYSGEGFFWLQLVVERLTGQGLSAFMRTRLFGPAGMTRSSFIGDAELAPRASFGHRGGVVASDQGWRSVLHLIVPLQAKWGKPIRDWDNDDWVRAAVEIVPKEPAPARVRFQNAAASMLTTAADCARFLSLVMDRSTRRSFELTEATRRAMVTAQVPVQQGEPFWWGLGWAVQRSDDGWRVSHEGNNDDRFTAYAGFDPARRRGLVVLTNGGSGFGVYQRIVRAATGLDQLSFVADVHPPRRA